MKPSDRLETAEAGNGSSRRELLTRAGLLAGAGTIAAVGPSTLGEATFAVIGGTGQFAGAYGSCRGLSQPPAPSGGTAEFTLDITAAGGRND